MTIILSGAALSLQTGTAASSVACLIGMSSGVGITYLGNIVGSGAFSAAPGAAAGSASTGAILSAGMTNTATGAVVGAVTAALSSGAVNLCQSLAMGPLGHLVLGTAIDKTKNEATFDCWKAILHDNSIELSGGKLFKEILTDVTVTEANFVDDDLVVTNVWGEKYRIGVVNMFRQVSLHAERVY